MAGADALGIDLGSYVAAERVLVVDHALGKRDLLTRLVDLTTAHPWVTDRAAFSKAIFEREDVTSTGIGGGVAVPHARLASVVGFVITLAVIPGGVDFLAQDGKPIRVAVMIAATDQDRKSYLRVLATVAARLKDPTRVPAMLSAAPDREAIVRRFVG